LLQHHKFSKRLINSLGAPDSAGQDEGRSSRELIEQQKRNGGNFLLR
jgi:hypothetical protein